LIASASIHARKAQSSSGRRAALYRLRVGDFRIIYEVRDKELLVLVVEVVRRNERSYHGL
jgi:mRNA-degrading endonuclease RelE of RelBE toxin-antitoxin system